MSSAAPARWAREKPSKVRIGKDVPKKRTNRTHQDGVVVSCQSEPEAPGKENTTGILLRSAPCRKDCHRPTATLSESNNTTSHRGAGPGNLGDLGLLPQKRSQHRGRLEMMPGVGASAKDVQGFSLLGSGGLGLGLPFALSEQQ